MKPMSDEKFIEMYKMLNHDGSFKKALASNDLKTVYSKVEDYCFQLNFKPQTITSFTALLNKADIDILSYMDSVPYSYHRSDLDLIRISIPEGIVDIGSYAFSDCMFLKNVDLPKSLKSIDGHAFDGCSSLTDIEIPENVNYIGFNAFSNCGNLSTVKLPKKFQSELEDIGLRDSSITKFFY